MREVTVRFEAENEGEVSQAVMQSCMTVLQGLGINVTAVQQREVTKEITLPVINGKYKVDGRGRVFSSN